TDGLGEPTLHHAGGGGERTFVVPGNKEYVEGDRIRRPPQGGGEGRGSEGSPDGEGQDAFQFVMSQDEFLDIFLEDLELPDRLRKTLRRAESFTPVRAGYQVSGPAANLNLKRTMRNSLSRRIALKRPGLVDIADLERQLDELGEDGDGEERQRLLLEIEEQ